MPSRRSPLQARARLKRSGVFTDREIDTLLTLSTLEAILFMIQPLVPAEPFAPGPD